MTKGYLLPFVVLLSLNQQVEEGKEVLKGGIESESKNLQRFKIWSVGVEK